MYFCDPLDLLFFTCFAHLLIDLLLVMRPENGSISCVPGHLGLVSRLLFQNVFHWIALILHEMRCFIEITSLIFFLACQVRQQRYSSTDTGYLGFRVSLRLRRQMLDNEIVFFLCVISILSFLKGSYYCLSPF